VTIALFFACLLAEAVDADVFQFPAQQFVQIAEIQRPIVPEEKEQQQKAPLLQEQQQKGGELEEKTVPPPPAAPRSQEVQVVAAAISPAVEATGPVVVTASDAKPDAASHETTLTQAQQAAAFIVPAQKFVEASSAVPSAQAQAPQAQLEEQPSATSQAAQPADHQPADTSAKTSIFSVSSSAVPSAAIGQSAPVDSSASAAGTAGQTEYLVFTPSQPQVAQAASSAATGSSASSARSQTEPQAEAQAQPQSHPVVTSIMPLGVIQATIQDVPPQTQAASQPLSQSAPTPSATIEVQPQSHAQPAQAQAQTVALVTASLSPNTLQAQSQTQAAGVQAAAADPNAQAHMPDAREQAHAQTAGSSTTQAVAVEAAATDAKPEAQARPVQGQFQSQTLTLSTSKAVQVQAASTDVTPQSPVQSAQAAPQTVTVVTSSETSPKLEIGAEAAKELTQELAAHPNTRVVVAVATQAVPAEKAAPIAPIIVSPQDTPSQPQVVPAATALAPAVSISQVPEAAEAPIPSLRASVAPKKQPEVESVATSTGYSAMFAAIVQSASFALFVKAACMISNVIFQVSPLPQVQQWVSQACTGEADSAPFVAIAFGGWQWCFYGIFAWLITQRSGFLILVHSNCLGALLGTYYSFAFERHCKSQSNMSGFWAYLRVAAGLAAIQFAAMLLLPIARALFLSGIIASLCSVASAASTLVTLPTVIKTGRSDSIPGAVVWAGLASAVIWFICGIMLSDPCILIPNGFAIVTGVACVILKIKFPSGDVVKDTAKFPTPQMGSTNSYGSLNANKMFSKPSVRSSGSCPASSSNGSAGENNAEEKPRGDAAGKSEEAQLSATAEPQPLAAAAAAEAAARHPTPTELTPFVPFWGGTGGTC